MADLIVADASPLIALYDGGELDVLQLAFEMVIIPERVLHEVFTNRYGRVKPRWIRVQAITNVSSLARLNTFHYEYFLDRGESEAIALAEELGTEVLLDERNARRICRDLGIPHRSAYDVVRKLAKEKRISDKRCRKICESLRLHHGFTPSDDDPGAAL